MAQNLLFTFEDMTSKDKPVKALERMFKRAGLAVAQSEVNATIKRSSSVSYRELMLTFADSQQVVMRIKQTGDIFQVLLNGKVMPLRYQDDHTKAVTELIKAMDTGRAAFQKKLARAQVALPPSIRTAAPKMLDALTQKRDALNEAIAEVRSKIDEFNTVAA